MFLRSKAQLGEVYSFLHRFAIGNGIKIEHVKGHLEIGKTGLSSGYTGLSYIQERRVDIGLSEAGHKEDRLLTLAHEIGHILDASKLGSGGGAAYLRQLTKKKQEALLDEEKSPWEKAHVLLRAAGYNNWPLIRRRVQRSLDIYRKKWRKNNG